MMVLAGVTRPVLAGLLALGALVCSPASALAAEPRVEACACVQLVDVGLAVEFVGASPDAPDPSEPADDQAPADDSESPEPELDDSSKDGKERLRGSVTAGEASRVPTTISQWLRDSSEALGPMAGHDGLPEKPPR